MDITCSRCKRSYFVPDDLVHGRHFRAKCSHCGAAFGVDVPEGLGAPAGPSGGLPAARASALPDLEGHLSDADLAWLDEGAARADAAAAAEDEVVLLTVRRGRRGTALALAAGAAVVLAVGGVALWSTGRKPAAGPAREQAPADRAARPALDAGGLGAKPKAAPAAAPEAAAAPAAPAERARPPRLANEDRHLLDLLGKKGDVSVAAPVAEEAGASARAALDPEAAERVLSANRKSFDACISRSLKLHPNAKLPRRATLVVTVSPAGRVSRAWVMEEEVDRTDLGTCLSDSARRLVFPAFDGDPLDISMPLALSAAY